MKKITLLLMVCCMSVMAFAAGGSITYVLNGGVTNDQGWTSKTDMLVAFSNDYNTKFSKATAWGAATTPGQIVATTYPDMYQLFEDAALGPKWAWLKEYILKVATDQVAIYNYLTPSGLQDGYDPRWRAAVDGFFTNSQYLAGAYNGGPDFTSAGQPQMFFPFWGHGWAGPATYDGTTAINLPDPYKEGFTFDGWYETADFQGTKVTSIPAGADGDKTLYAKWVEYIPTCAEIWVATAGATKAAGIVTYISGTTVYIQDASAGLQVQFTTAPSVVAGDKITLSGTNAGNGKITSATLGGKEAASLPAYQTVTIAALKADANNTYTYKYIYIQGVKITTKTAGNLTLADDNSNSIVMSVESTLPVGTLVNVKAVVSYDGTTLILVGLADNITAAPVPRPDPFTYAARGATGQYVLKSKWLVSNTLDNYTANPVGTEGYVRGMTAIGGKMYFVNRETKQLIVVDGATGQKLASINLAANIFEIPGTLAFNDIKQDAAGHILLGNCVSEAQPFQIWKIDLATGNGTLVINETLNTNPDFKTSVRIDAFGVYGDVDHDAIIMGASSTAMEVYKWTIQNGVAAGAEKIEVDRATEGTGLTNLGNPGSAPQVFPVDENYFYLDGNATLASLIDAAGQYVDGFYDPTNAGVLYSAATDATTKPGSEWKLGPGPNGLCEFEVNGEYFLIVSASNTDGVPKSTFRLFKFADANKEFKDMETLWTFPADGMGGASGAYRTAMPCVEVNQTTGVASIYLYYGGNGYGVYEFRTNGGGQGIKNSTVNSLVIYGSNKTIQFTESVASAQVYNVAGQLINKKLNTTSVNVAVSGIYIVKATTLNGETVVSKVVVK